VNDNSITVTVDPFRWDERTEDEKRSIIKALARERRERLRRQQQTYNLIIAGVLAFTHIWAAFVFYRQGYKAGQADSKQVAKETP
jgi:hypothetical protein